MATLSLALVSSLLWGIADYLGGLRSRSFAVPVVLALMYVASLVASAIFVAIRGGGPPGSSSVLAAVLAGIVGISALSAFYRALAIGTMSIVAPIASTGVVLPVIAGVVDGEHPGVIRSIGIAAAVAGVVLATRSGDGALGPSPGRQGAGSDRDHRRRSILLALVAGLGFGSYFIAADVASRGGVAWSLLLSRVAAAPIVVAVALVVVRRGGRLPVGRELLALAGIGLLDLGANAAYNQATTLGELSVAAVAGSLYPVTTVVLAAVLLGERVRGMQRAGVAVALTGVLLIAAGG